MDAYKHRRLGGRAGKMRLAHHIIWEAVNGPIPARHLIHHIDHNKQNNDVENLQLVTTSEHQRIHSPYYGKLNGTWLQICPDCKGIDAVPRRQPTCDGCRARRARIERRQKKSQNKTPV